MQKILNEAETKSFFKISIFIFGIGYLAGGMYQASEMVKNGFFHPAFQKIKEHQGGK